MVLLNEIWLFSKSLVKLMDYVAKTRSNCSLYFRSSRNIVGHIVKEQRLACSGTTHLDFIVISKKRTDDQKDYRALKNVVTLEIFTTMIRCFANNDNNVFLTSDSHVKLLGT